jgi:hypothetical protein
MDSFQSLVVKKMSRHVEVDCIFIKVVVWQDCSVHRLTVFVTLMVLHHDQWKSSEVQMTCVGGEQFFTVKSTAQKICKKLVA